MEVFFSSGRERLRSLLVIYFPVNTHFGDRPEENRMINGQINKTQCLAHKRLTESRSENSAEHIFVLLQ